ncbi:MAG: UDP-glucose dehydrogenase family protein [Candidatus Heimdallarchaeota archaeon]
MTTKVKISIAGVGFVGLVTGAVFADKGYPVTALDIDETKVTMLNKGQGYFFEPHLQELIQRVVLEKKTLAASTDLLPVIKESDCVFICVNTSSQADGSIDLSNIKSIATTIGQALAEKVEYSLIIVKSTVVPGTTYNVVKEIIEQESGKKAGKDFGLCMSPEFLREGQSIYDAIYPDRIVIGEFDKKSGDKLLGIFQELYNSKDKSFTDYWFNTFKKPITLPELLRSSLETAECIKYANNTFLATKISFINEFANICENLPGVDVNDVAKGIGLDHRISSKFLQAGAGFGGSCFRKDLNAIIHFAKSKDYQPKLLESTLEINDQQAQHMIALTKTIVGEIKNKTIAILGLSFKPETSDMRDAPSLKIINGLLKLGAKIIAYDPQAMEEAQEEHYLGSTINYAENVEDALDSADACLIVTEWSHFKELTPQVFKEKMKTPIIIDGRRIFNPKLFIDNGIQYVGIGLGK